MNYNFKVIYRPGAQNHVADALSRIEPLTDIERNEIENEQKCFILTRGQAKRELNENLNDIKHTIEERSGTILNKRNFDLIFHMIPFENDTLKNKIMNKFGITSFSQKWHNFNKIHYARTISNQFANRQNTNETSKCVREILGISENNG